MKKQSNLPRPSKPKPYTLPYVSRRVSEFKKRWQTCKRCSFGSICSSRIHYRGQIPCDLLIVGEAPGEVEALTGTPFDGPAGQLLNAVINSTLDPDISICIANAILCIPYVDDALADMDTPNTEQIKACNPRLREFIDLAFAKPHHNMRREYPKTILCLGKVARTALKLIEKGTQDKDAMAIFETIHPAAILRQGWSEKDNSGQGKLDRRRMGLKFEEVNRYINSLRG